MDDSISLGVLRVALNQQRNQLSAARATLTNLRLKEDAQEAEVETRRQNVEDLEAAIRLLEEKG